jgi:hypothetical protein
MQKIYSKKCFNQSENQGPSEETVNFLISYSKALKMVKYNNLEFETLLN